MREQNKQKNIKKNETEKEVCFFKKKKTNKPIKMIIAKLSFACSFPV